MIASRERYPGQQKAPSTRGFWTLSACKLDQRLGALKTHHKKLPNIAASTATILIISSMFALLDN